MATSISPLEFLRAMTAELKRRDQIKRLVAAAGYAKDDKAWVLRSDVSAAVARLLGREQTPGLGLEIRRVLVGEKWVERKHCGYWQWRSRLVTAGAAVPPRRSASRRRNYGRLIGL